ncbi:hypothetical protein CTA1_8588 [Colletotrichum tanaceti]|uniref:Uncharacterized protein n=1 Tax=Colletotrichum tanaceti TaxID=1306861 RepID=A0A4U6X987_9PEZI|nr:hypothetical protein CTA1_8588 [Colletotrichum tanaceti]
MEKLKTVLWPASRDYSTVRTSQSDDDEPHEGVEERLREELATLESNVWCLRMSLLITASALVLVTVFAVVSRVSCVRSSLACGKGHIGSDPNGFVPPGE